VDKVSEDNAGCKRSWDNGPAIPQVGTYHKRPQPHGEVTRHTAGVRDGTLGLAPRCGDTGSECQRPRNRLLSNFCLDNTCRELVLPTSLQGQIGSLYRWRPPTGNLSHAAALIVVLDAGDWALRQEFNEVAAKKLATTRLMNEATKTAVKLRDLLNGHH
jgi:hypothetical protein